eukprot:SAG31_NODE_48493_length_185_cov_10.860465_1_plen_30_part_10
MQDVKFRLISNGMRSQQPLIHGTTGAMENR